MSKFEFSLEPQKMLIRPEVRVSGDKMGLYLNGSCILALYGERIEIWTDELEWKKIGELKGNPDSYFSGFSVSLKGE